MGRDYGYVIPGAKLRRPEQRLLCQDSRVILLGSKLESVRSQDIKGHVRDIQS